MVASDLDKLFSYISYTSIICNTALKAYCKHYQLQRHRSSTAARRSSRGSNNDSFHCQDFVSLFLITSSFQYLNPQLFLLLKNVINNYSVVFPSSVSTLAFMTLQNLLLMEVSGTVLSKNKCNNPCILPDTFTIHYCNLLTLPYIDMIQYVTVYQGKRKTGYTYCPFGKPPPVSSAGVGL